MENSFLVKRTSSGLCESTLNWVEPKMRWSCQAVDAKVYQVAQNVIGLCFMAVNPGFLNQKPANQIVFGAALFAKCATPVAVCLYFGPVGVCGTLLLLPIVKQCAYRTATVAGNVASHATLSFLGFGSFLKRVQFSVNSDDVPFVISLFGTMVGDVVGFGIRDLPIDTLAKMAAKTGSISSIKLLAKAPAQAGYNYMFGKEFVKNPMFGLEEGAHKIAYRTGAGHLKVMKVLEEIGCTFGSSAVGKSIVLDNWYAQLAVNFGGGYMATELVRFIGSLPKLAGELYREDSDSEMQRQGIKMVPRKLSGTCRWIQKFLFLNQEIMSV